MGDTGRFRASLVLGWSAVLAGLLVLAAVAAVATVRPWETTPAAPPSPPPVAEPEPAAVLAAVGHGAPALTPAEVHAAIDDLLAGSGLGSRLSAAVVDVATGEHLYGWDPERLVIPASTIKLVTGATVLAARGPAYRIPTTVVAGAEPGEVVLVGGGDPTLAVDADGFYPDAARLDLLATQVISALGGTPVTKVTVDSTLFTGDRTSPWTGDIVADGWVAPVTALMTDGGRQNPDPRQGQQASARWDQPDLAAGRDFAELLGVPAETVARGEAPAGGAMLGEVRSPSLLRLVEIMLAGSDNMVGEMLARQVPVARGEPASFPGMAAAMTAVLTDELGLAGSIGDSVIADGSGLSRDNRLSARLLTDLLAMAAAPAPAGDPPAGALPAGERLAGLFAGLPVSGWSGTLATRHETPPPEVAPGVGVVRAKTGSLTGVDALAGVVVTSGGRLLAFAVLAGDVPIGRPASWVALDRVPATLATL